MDQYITGKTIRLLREKKQLTQKELADGLAVSDKTISKWENLRGYPDISLLKPLADALGVNIAELITGNIIENSNRSSNMKKIKFYVCPMCGNVIHSVGEAHISCCGIELPVLEIEENDEEHTCIVESTNGGCYINLPHEMSKQHYISFLSYVTSNHIETIKLYPEQNAEAHFAVREHGFIYWYCNKHGLFRTYV